MLCYRCQKEFQDTELFHILIPVINENGRDLLDAYVCVDCHIDAIFDNRKVYDKNNKLMDILEEMHEVSPARVITGNEVSDEVYPLNPDRVPSIVPDSLEAWCRTQTPTEFNETVLQHMVDSIGRE